MAQGRGVLRPPLPGLVQVRAHVVPASLDLGLGPGAGVKVTTPFDSDKES